jgi:hypothetical protein
MFCGNLGRPDSLARLFRRGEAAREVRMQAAQGILAPRAHEQLEILVLLLEDSDAEIRQVADTTLNRFRSRRSRALARSDGVH